MKSRLCLCAMLLWPLSGYAQGIVADLQQELVAMQESDQRRGEIRNIENEYGYGSPEYLEAWDRQNAIDQAN